MSIADKLTYLQTTKQLLKTEINKINNVLDDNSTFRSYPQELFNGYLDILNNGTDTLWSNLEKVSQTGTEAVLEGVETAPMKMVLNGNTSQDGTPTPDTPVEVKVVKGENVVSVSGKNWFNFTNGTYSNHNITATVENGKITLNGTADADSFINIPCTTNYEAEVGDTFSLSINNIATNSNGLVRLNGNGTYDLNFGNANAKRTFTIINDRIPYLDKIVIKSISGTSYNNFVIYPQLELGSTATPYVPYSKTDYPINLGDIELCKINTYKDYLFKRNGKWYVHKEIGKVVLNGSENWNSGAFGTNSFTLSKRDMKYSSNAEDTNILIKCSHFKGVAIKDRTTSGDNIIYAETSASIYIRNTTYSTLESFKTMLGTNNMILYYVLATPTEEEITNTTLIEQLEAISKAKSVKDKTYITQTNDELPFVLDVEAIKKYEVA